MEEYPNVISYEVDGYSGYSGWLGKNQQYIIYTDLCKIYIYYICNHYIVTCSLFSMDMEIGLLQRTRHTRGE